MNKKIPIHYDDTELVVEFRKTLSTIIAQRDLEVLRELIRLREEELKTEAKIEKKEWELECIKNPILHRSAPNFYIGRLT